MFAKEDRVRVPTEKGKVYEAATCLASFKRVYNAWKDTARSSRLRLKENCPNDVLEDLKFKLEEQREMLLTLAERLRRVDPLAAGVVQKLDTCSELTQQLMEMIEERLEVEDSLETPDFVFASDVHMRLPKTMNPSVFGDSSSSFSSINFGQEPIKNSPASVSSIVSSPKHTETVVAVPTSIHSDPNLMVAATTTHSHTNDHVIHANYQLSPHAPEFMPPITKPKGKWCPSCGSHLSAGAHFCCHCGIKQVAVTADLSAIVDSLEMPRVELPSFDGNPIHFMEFMSAYEDLVNSKQVGAAKKLQMLFNSVSESVKTALRPYLTYQAEEGLKEALLCLKTRYGDVYKVARAHVDDLLKGAPVSGRDPQQLRVYSDRVKGCFVTLKSLNMLDEVESRSTMIRLIGKLPDFIQARWRKEVYQYKSRHGKYPKSEDFMSFLEKIAGEANDPYFGDTLHELEQRTPSTPKFRGGRSNTLQTSTFRSEDVKPACLFCKGDHRLWRCSEFNSTDAREKRRFLFDRRLCYSCLNPGHRAQRCEKKQTCSVCKEQHPTCLHGVFAEPGDQIVTKEGPQQGVPEVERKPEAEVETAANKATFLKSDSTSFTVPVLVSSATDPQKEVLTYALLDSQSDSSFVLESLADQLEVPRRPVHLKLSTMSSNSSVSVQCSSVENLLVRGLDRVQHVRVDAAYTREFIPVDRSSIPTSSTAEKWPHLEHIATKMKDLLDCEVGLLMGYDCPSALTPVDVVAGSEGEPFAVETCLGWSVVGPSNPCVERPSNVFVHRSSARELAVDIRAIKALEKDFNELPSDNYFSQDDMKFLKVMKDGICIRPDGHLQIPLPFASENPPRLPNNRKLAEIRMGCLQRKLLRDSALLKQYTDFMEAMLERGHAERAPEYAETAWYIPHHAVHHPKKPDKVRVVFDCSANFQGTSLNQHLLSGPELVNSLVGVLCRFRENIIAVVCDIEQMFYQFAVPVEQRDFLRFLWWEKGDLARDPKEFRMTVHLFGASSSPGCCNFGLKHAARLSKGEYPLASQFVDRNFYVDDGLVSVASPEEAVLLAQQAQQLCAQHGIRLHKFNSNCADVLKGLDPKDVVSSEDPVKLDTQEECERTLGVRWNLEKDTFGFSVSASTQPDTRRGVLSAVASLFDPLGFAAPFVLKGKLVLQGLCSQKLSWDDSLPPDDQSRWEEWKDGLQELRHFQLSRCYRTKDFGEIMRAEIHHFADASSIGYGACSYLRLMNEHGKVHCCLVLAKARVAPTKLRSIPRLELTAAVVASRLALRLREELDIHIESEYFWSDSRVVLGYIANDARKFHVFVANRVQAIRENSKPSQWFYVESEQNPADLASRGMNPSQLMDTIWLKGPSFLWNGDFVPSDDDPSDLREGDPEVRSVHVCSTLVIPDGRADLIQRFEKISSWNLLIRVVARIRRLSPRNQFGSDVISADEKSEATLTVVKLIQGEHYQNEIEMLQCNADLPLSSSIAPLSPFLDNTGVLRVGGRLHRSCLSDAVKHPVILPKRSVIALRFAYFVHESLCHPGYGQTMNGLRSRGYWIVAGSHKIAGMIKNCVVCRRMRRPPEIQKMSDLPQVRVTCSAPFSSVGLDCFGPFYTKRGRSQCKRYGLLVTCLSCRAVHIEMLEDMSTDSFINALRCVIAIRGPIEEIRCDQGTNFTGAVADLDCAFGEVKQALQVFASNVGCKFVFNAPGASHAGGVWERQIRSVRSVLNHTLSLSAGRLDDSALRTLLYEAMAIVNSRPLSPTTLNDPLAEPPITPNHFLTLKGGVVESPPGTFVKEDLFSRKQWRRVQYLCEQLWSRWRKEYLLLLQSRQKWIRPRRNVSAGDIVILVDESMHRNSWRLARVIESFPSKDGLVRKVKVLTSLPTGRTSILERPVQKIVVLVESH